MATNHRGIPSTPRVTQYGSRQRVRVDPSLVEWCHRAGVMLGAEDWGTLAPGPIPAAGEGTGGQLEKGNTPTAQQPWAQSTGLERGILEGTGSPAVESKGIERRAYITLPRDVFYLTAQKTAGPCSCSGEAAFVCQGRRFPATPLCPPAADGDPPPPSPNHSLVTGRKETEISRARLSGRTKAPCKRPGAGRVQRGMLRAQPAFPLFVWKRRSRGGAGGMQGRMLGMMLNSIRAPSATS